MNKFSLNKRTITVMFAVCFFVCIFIGVIGNSFVFSFFAAVLCLVAIVLNNEVENKNRCKR